ncbi:MAG: type II secretion system F family protein [Rhodospirillales bacterium]|jgi:tight adherence protein C|nr:type II secretion system F family protein [Rhodospirillales bacterium]
MNLMALLSELAKPETVLTVLAGLAATAIIGLVWSAAIARDPLSDRAKDLKQRRETLRGDLLLAKQNRTRRQAALGIVHRTTNRLNLLRSQHAASVALKLAQAGWRAKDAVSIYMFLKLCLPFVFGGAAAVGVFWLGAFDLPPIGRVFVAMLAVVIGAYAPEVFVKNATTKRMLALQKGLPDALDLLVICTEAGLALDGALTRVAGESEKSCPELADEFGLTAIELGFLPVRRTALENLIKRVDLPAMRGVVNTLLQTEKYGTPVAQSLRVLSAEFREERMLKAEEKAAKLPATLTVPLIVFIMPTLFIVLLGPAILRALDGLGGL